MPRILKWLLFVALCAAYVWAVFFWPQRDTQAAPAVEEEATEVQVLEYPDEPIQTEVELDTDSFYDDDLGETEELEDFSIEEEPTSEEEPIVQNNGDYAFFIISGSYLEEAPAQRAAQAYSDEGVEAEVRFFNPYYKVVVGKAQSMSEAKQLLQEVTDSGVSAFIQRN